MLELKVLLCYNQQMNLRKHIDFINLTESALQVLGICPLKKSDGVSYAQPINGQCLLFAELIGVVNLKHEHFTKSSARIRFLKLNSACKSQRDSSLYFAFSLETNESILNYFSNKCFELTDYEKTLILQIATELDSLFGQKHTADRKAITSSKLYCGQIIKNAAELLLISIIRNSNYNNNGLNNDSSILIQTNQISEKIIKILEKRLYSSVNLDEIASQLFFSKTYIKYIFKKQTGSSIIQYYNRLKIEEAARFITQKSYSYTEIASKIGFSSVQYFTRMFKTITGMTPSEYERSLHN